MNAAELFPGEMEKYLQASADLAREEVRIQTNYERSTQRLRREAGRRYARMLGLDPDRWWSNCAILILHPDLKERLGACRRILQALHRQDSAPKPRHQREKVS